MKDFCAVLLRFKVKEGRMAEMLTLLEGMMDRCAKEPAFVSAVRHTLPGRPEEVMLYELWRGTRDLFQIEQGPRPYRKAFIQSSREFVEAVEIEWSVPVAQWGTPIP